jgi:hypothetical protein
MHRIIFKELLNYKLVAIVYKPGEPLFLMQVIKSIRALELKIMEAAKNYRKAENIWVGRESPFLYRRYKPGVCKI